MRFIQTAADQKHTRINQSWTWTHRLHWLISVLWTKSAKTKVFLAAPSQRGNVWSVSPHTRLIVVVAVVSAERCESLRDEQVHSDPLTPGQSCVCTIKVSTAVRLFVLENYKESANERTVSDAERITSTLVLERTQWSRTPPGLAGLQTSHWHTAGLWAVVSLCWHLANWMALVLMPAWIQGTVWHNI